MASSTPRFFRLTEQQLLHAYLPEDLINECMDRLRPHDLEVWKVKMQPVHRQFQETLRDWFSPVSFFVNRQTRQPRIIMFVDHHRKNALLDDLSDCDDSVDLCPSTKNYYGLERFPKYIDWHHDFACIDEHMDSEYATHTWSL